MFLLTLLYKGTIKRLFSDRKVEVKEVHDPLSIPQNEFQCVHVEFGFNEEGPIYDRCLNVAELGPNGYLCKEHSKLMDEIKKASVKVPVRELNDEVIDGIKKHEDRALQGKDKEFVKITAKGEGIRYLVH